MSCDIIRAIICYYAAVLKTNGNPASQFCTETYDSNLYKIILLFLIPFGCKINKRIIWNSIKNVIIF